MTLSQKIFAPRDAAKSQCQLLIISFFPNEIYYIKLS